MIIFDGIRTNMTLVLDGKQPDTHILHFMEYGTYPLLFWPQPFFIIVQSITDDLFKILGYLHSGGPVTCAIIALMLWTAWWLGGSLRNNQQLVDLMVTKFIVRVILRPKTQVKCKIIPQWKTWKRYLTFLFHYWSCLLDMQHSSRNMVLGV